MRFAIKTGTTAGVATCAALAAAITLSAPEAGAVITRVQIERGQSFAGSSESHGTGCGYTLIATTDPGKEVVFLDSFEGDVRRAPFQPAVVTADASGQARTTWTPAQRGQHYIVVVEREAEGIGDLFTSDTPLNVGTGINVGPTCAVLP